MSTQCTDDHDEGDFRAEFLGAVLVLKDDDAWRGARDALLSGQALKGAKGMGNILAPLLKLESPFDLCFKSLLSSHGGCKAVRYKILFEPYFALAHHSLHSFSILLVPSCICECVCSGGLRIAPLKERFGLITLTPTRDPTEIPT